MSGDERQPSTRVIDRALEFGADLAGIANADELKRSPSHYVLSRLGPYAGVGTKETNGVMPAEVAWPEDAKSVVVIAVAHPEGRPHLDWWRDGYPGGTEGNRRLIAVGAKLAGWLEEEHGIKPAKLPYHIERGGIFLKDAAVMAGLGCLGRDNLLITPRYGPRVRLWAMTIDRELPVTGPADFDPCLDCDEPCRRACPQEGFAQKIYSDEPLGIEQLPARNGVYDRHLCNVQMELDVAHHEPIAVEGQKVPGKLVRFCRQCEFACPVGKLS